MRRSCKVAAAGLAFLLAACAQTTTQPIKETIVSLQANSSASRVGMSDLPPILFEGKRYQQVLNGQREGLDQRTGLMKVVDLDSGASTFVSIYDVPREPGLEPDAGDVFFSSFVLDEGRREIRIENERRQGYVYSIDSKAVTPLK